MESSTSCSGNVQEIKHLIKFGRFWGMFSMCIAEFYGQSETLLPWHYLLCTCPTLKCSYQSLDKFQFQDKLPYYQIHERLRSRQGRQTCFFCVWALAQWVRQLMPHAQNMSWWWIVNDFHYSWLQKLNTFLWENQIKKARYAAYKTSLCLDSSTFPLLDFETKRTAPGTRVHISGSSCRIVYWESIVPPNLTLVQGWCWEFTACWRLSVARRAQNQNTVPSVTSCNMSWEAENRQEQPRWQSCPHIPTGEPVLLHSRLPDSLLALNTALSILYWNFTVLQAAETRISFFSSGLECQTTTHSLNWRSLDPQLPGSRPSQSCQAVLRHSSRFLVIDQNWSTGTLADWKAWFLGEGHDGLWCFKQPDGLYCWVHARSLGSIAREF